MRTVRQLLEAKSPEVLAIAPDAPVLEAIKLMATHGIGALLVMDGPALVGILSERDYARKVVLEGRSSKDTPVREIMSGAVKSVSPADTCPHCMEMMTEHRVRHLPVLEDGRVIGILSIGDLVKAVIAQQQRELDHLHSYIHS